MPPLDAFYRRLLFTYPAGYRAQHEDEIVTTLLDAAPQGRRLPSLRETAGLITGGLRIGAVAAAREGGRAQWVDSLRLAAALLLAYYMSSILPLTQLPRGLRAYLYPILLGAVLVMTMRGATRAALALLAAAVPLGWWYLVMSVRPIWSSIWEGHWQPVWILSAIVILPAPLVLLFTAAPLVLLFTAGTALIVCTVTQRHKPWSWWLVGVVALYPLAYFAQMRNWGHVHIPPGPVWLELSSYPNELLPLLTGLALSVLALVARDPRPAIAAAIYLVASHYTILLTVPLVAGTFVVTELLAIAAIVQSRRLVASDVLPENT